MKPGASVKLPGSFDPAYQASFVKKSDADEHLEEGIRLLAQYQDRLAAQRSYGLLVVLQGLDASGKDGVVKHVMSGVNPQGVEVHSFKVPTDAELHHDYLWRYQLELPERGQITIFNRSHYEEVLVVRVHPENLQRQNLPSEAADENVWNRRFREINDWERYLVANGIRVVKFFLHVSKDEQRKRLLERINDPEKNWKYSAADILERRFWDDYQVAYSDALSNTSTDWAPWYVIPADHKWFAHLAVAGILVERLMEVDPQYPKLSEEQKKELERAKLELA